MSPSIFPRITSTLEIGRRKVLIGNNKTSKEYFMHQHLWLVICEKRFLQTRAGWQALNLESAIPRCWLRAPMMKLRGELVVGECFIKGEQHESRTNP